ncbi:MAG TPA: hypothetical protein VNJ08_00515 [Bacteriovoracaceae bacterium]|nr:hypothetical protein [Bacteriovoracaceae bacterium]
MKLPIHFVAILLFSTLCFANDKEARGVLIQKKFASTGKEMKKCLEAPNRQVFPSFSVKFAIKEENAKDISFPDSELKTNEVSCLESVIKKIKFEGIKSAQVQQNINFQSISGSE